MSETLAELGHGLEIWKVGIDEAREQDQNARVMMKNAFEHLTRTIGRDSRLEQLPFLAATDAGLFIVGGHHRIRAARTAELDHYFALVDTTNLSQDEITAKQLAHNAIQGDDDEEILARLYESIKSVDARIESFIDADAIAERISVEVANLDVGLDYRTALITFLPYEKTRFEGALEKLVVEISRETDAIYMAELDQLEQFKEMLKRVGKEYEVRATGTQLATIAGIVEEHLGIPPDPDDEYVPVRKALGSGMIHQDDVDKIRRAIKKTGTLSALVDEWETNNG